MECVNVSNAVMTWLFILLIVQKPILILELLLELTPSICCFRFISDAVNDPDELNKKSTENCSMEIYLSSTTVVNEQLAIRP